VGIQTVVAQVQGGRLVSSFPPRSVNQTLQSLTIVGPSGSAADVWVGVIGDAGSHVDTTPNGDQNSTEYLYPKAIVAGSILSVTWTATAGLAYAVADIALSTP
jgi:hypothetical protein